MGAVYDFGVALGVLVAVTVAADAAVVDGVDAFDIVRLGAVVCVAIVDASGADTVVVSIVVCGVSGCLRVMITAATANTEAAPVM